MYRIILLLILSTLLLSSCTSKKEISNEKDYHKYMQDGLIKKEAEKSVLEINFWENRLQKDTGSYVNMLELAINYLSLFKHTGKIAYLNTGDSLLKRSSAKLNNTNPEILFSLTQNSITQHNFIQAANYTAAAKKLDADMYTIRLLEFDTFMELGKYKEAISSLKTVKDKLSFDYLVRMAKWEDHSGNLEAAIELMETAFKKIKEKNKSLYCWTLSNLGDMYGHAGRIEDAYHAYLNVLKKDPSNLYCLKGIAWITYSHDNKTKEAKEILKFILSQIEMPDLKLVLAEIAETEGDIKTKQDLLLEFITDVTKPGYGDMYNKYLIKIYAEELKNPDVALVLATKELNNRFTPQTCDGIAWAYYNKGHKEKAFEYSRGYVNKYTFEPEALLHSAFIYADNGKKSEAIALFKKCLESEFELGPIAVTQIKSKLSDLQ